MNIFEQAKKVLLKHSGCVMTAEGAKPFDADLVANASIREAFAEILKLDEHDEILFVARRHDEVDPRILPVDLLLAGLQAVLVVVGNTGIAKVYPPAALRRKTCAIQMGTI